MITITITREGDVFTVAAGRVTVYAGSPAAALRAVVSLASEEVHAIAGDRSEIDAVRAESHRLAAMVRTRH